MTRLNQPYGRCEDESSRSVKTLRVMLVVDGEAGGVMSEPVRPAAQAEPERAVSRWPRWSSDLHESLASHEASASELRQELDDLRRTLDAAPAGEAARRTRPSRRVILVAGAGAVLVLALAARAAGSGSSTAPTVSTATTARAPA